MTSYREGQRVRTDTHLGDEDGRIDRIRGRVIGDQCTNRGADGVERVQIQTEDGTIFAVPTRAVRPEGKR